MKIIQDTDIGQSLKIENNKLEINAELVGFLRMQEGSVNTGIPWTPTKWLKVEIQGQELYVPAFEKNSTTWAEFYRNQGKNYVSLGDVYSGKLAREQIYLNPVTRWEFLTPTDGVIFDNGVITVDVQETSPTGEHYMKAKAVFIDGSELEVTIGAMFHKRRFNEINQPKTVEFYVPLGTNMEYIINGFNNWWDVVDVRGSYRKSDFIPMSNSNTVYLNLTPTKDIDTTVTFVYKDGSESTVPIKIKVLNVPTNFITVRPGETYINDQMRKEWTYIISPGTHVTYNDGVFSMASDAPASHMETVDVSYTDQHGNSFRGHYFYLETPWDV